MAHYIDIEHAKNTEGLRIVAPPGRPNPWAEGLKGMCHVKHLPYILVSKAAGYDATLQDWTRQSSAPVAVWQDERPRTTWNEQIYLVERLAPEPSLVPDDSDERMTLFGLCNELCGETGFGWLRRIMVVHGILTNPDVGEQGKAAASYLGGKYGYSPAAAEAAPQRVAQMLQTLSARLASQQNKGSRYLVGDTLTALDIYWSTFAVLVQPLPLELCPMDPAFHASFFNRDTLVADALSPTLLEHRDRIYHDHLQLPMDF
jgi:glutathione S-transferase